MFKADAFRQRRGVYQHGVPITLLASHEELLNELQSRLFLPGWEWNTAGEAVSTFALGRSSAGFQAFENSTLRLTSTDLDEVCTYLAGRIYHCIAAHSPELFVHTGAVSLAGGAVLFPGSSLAGKSTLVQAMLALGAGYLSDEFAVLSSGSSLVQPFPRTIRLRTGPSGAAYVAPPGPLPLRAVIAVRYAEGLQGLRIREMSAGETALRLFQNTVSAQRLGSGALQQLLAACRDSRGWAGTRGDASAAAQKIMRLLT